MHDKHNIYNVLVLDGWFVIVVWLVDGLGWVGGWVGWVVGWLVS